jgi:squalene synthase HpnC
LTARCHGVRLAGVSADAEASRLARRHYENFPVGSWLLPRALRPHVHRIYAFARTADDLADEARDLAALREWRAATERALLGERDGVPPLLVALAETVRERRLPERLLFDLLDAFERDLAQSRYADLDDLLSYCRQSADPIGRLLLHLFGRADDESLRLADRVCTSLQIVNHLQDVAGDYRERGRVYLPRDLMRRHGVEEAELGAENASPGLRRCLAELAAFCRNGLAAGLPLAARLGGRLGLELRAIVAGAGLVLDKLERADFDVLGRRPRLRAADGPALVIRTLWPRR